MSQRRLLQIVFICLICLVVFGHGVAAQDSLARPNVQHPPRVETKQEPQNNTINGWLYGKFSDEPYKIKNGDDEETRLKKQRINMAKLELNHFKEIVGMGLETLDTVIDAQKRLLEAQLDFHSKQQEIVSVIQQALDSAKRTEAIVLDQFQEGADVNIAQVARAKYYRLDLEINLLQANKKYGLHESSVEKNKK